MYPAYSDPSTPQNNHNFKNLLILVDSQLLEILFCPDGNKEMMLPPMFLKDLAAGCNFGLGRRPKGSVPANYELEQLT